MRVFLNLIFFVVEKYEQQQYENLCLFQVITSSKIHNKEATCFFLQNYSILVGMEVGSFPFIAFEPQHNFWEKKAYFWL